MEGLTDGDRGRAETVMLLFASLLPLPPATKGFNRVVNSLTHWLSDSALNVAEKELSVPAAWLWGGGGAGEVRQGERLAALAGPSLSAGLSVLGASAEAANEGSD